MSQQQRLSPQLQQSLAILQAQVGELRQMIGQEMAQNPVLEAEERDTSEDEERQEAELEDDDFAAEFEKLSQMDEEWSTYLQQSNSTHGPRTSEEEDRRQFLFDSLAAPVSLQDQLMQQLAMAECSAEVRALAEMLIGSLDERGFLAATVAETSLQQGIPLVDLEAAKEKLPAVLLLGSSRTMGGIALLQIGAPLFIHLRKLLKFRGKVIVFEFRF